MSSASDGEDDPQPLESIVTLPPRGVFAEAQLGHCNSCEKRDVTRMWDWTEMTTEEPPPISGIQPGPQGQMPNLTPSQLPANVIQITQPQAAPDPTGLANALGLLKTPNIFRDMSGLDQASAILGKLVDGTNKTLDDMVKGASQAKAQVDAERAKGAGSNTGNGTGGGTRQKQTPTERYDNLQVAKEVAKAADQLGLNDQQMSGLMDNILRDEARTDANGEMDAGVGIQMASGIIGAAVDLGSNGGKPPARPPGATIRESEGLASNLRAGAEGESQANRSPMSALIRACSLARCGTGTSGSWTWTSRKFSMRFRTSR